MTTDELRRLLAAPEILVVDVVDAALHALALALVVEHPTLDDLDDDPAFIDDPPVRRRARVALRVARRLRSALRAYRRAVDHALADPQDQDLPF